MKSKHTYAGIDFATSPITESILRSFGFRQIFIEKNATNAWVASFPINRTFLGLALEYPDDQQEYKPMEILQDFDYAFYEPTELFIRTPLQLMRLINALHNMDVKPDESVLKGKKQNNKVSK